MSDSVSPFAGGGGPPLTPSAFLEAVAARPDRLHGADAAPVLLRAIPVKSGAGKEYAGVIYATLRDPRTTDSLDARIPAELVAGLEWNREAVFAGLIAFKARRGELRAEFRVDSVLAEGAARLPAKDELLERWAQAATRPKRDPAAALQGERPAVVLVTGVGSVAADDVRAQLREAEHELDLRVVRVPMNRPAEVAKAVRQAAGEARVVALTRGGGEGVHDLDVDELIGAVASCPVPILAALGHATDLVVARVADAAIPTPTALGAWLRQTAEHKRVQARQPEEVRLLGESRELLAQLGRLRTLEAALARWRLLAALRGPPWPAPWRGCSFGRNRSERRAEGQ